MNLDAGKPASINWSFSFFELQLFQLIKTSLTILRKNMITYLRLELGNCHSYNNNGLVCRCNKEITRQLSSTWYMRHEMSSCPFVFNAFCYLILPCDFTFFHRTFLCNTRNVKNLFDMAYNTEQNCFLNIFDPAMYVGIYTH